MPGHDQLIWFSSGQGFLDVLSNKLEGLQKTAVDLKGLLPHSHACETSLDVGFDVSEQVQQRIFKHELIHYKLCQI